MRKKKRKRKTKSLNGDDGVSVKRFIDVGYGRDSEHRVEADEKSWSEVRDSRHRD